MSLPATSDTTLEQLCINAVRVLAMDGVQKADSGHPGTPMALAPLGYVLYTRHLAHNPANPHWADRDRFVLSAGHASMFLYSVLYLSGYEVTLEDLKQFRQWGSKTPGHPEAGHTAGVETTTGPLGQGVGNAIGMAVAESALAATFNKPGHTVVDHYTYFIAGDGDLMEGVSHEAASFAGHHRLGKLIGFYDDNRITIEGPTTLTYTAEEATKRFESYGWHVQHLADVNDLAAIDAAIEAAKKDPRPSLIITRTHIGFGSPHKQDTSKAHGEPLGEEEISLTKDKLGYPSKEPFWVAPDALAYWRKATDRGAKLQAAWDAKWSAYATAFPAEAAEYLRRMRGELPAGWESAIPTFSEADGSVASRAASGKVLNALATKIPELVGGSADLAPSTNTLMKGAGDFTPEQHGGRNFHFGIREHGMGSIMNGLALHGGFVVFGATFLVFSDYMRPPIRLAALMHKRVVYVFTHDSIGLGEDGPTHQPVEQLAALRCIPNLTVLRPADSNETAEAWRTAIAHTTGPVALVFTRQKLALIDRAKHGSAAGVAKGAYVLSEASGAGAKVVLMSSGSEVSIVLAAQTKLEAAGIPTRVVSMPSHELFASQSQAYRDGVLTPGVPRVAIEAAHPMPWYRWVGTDGVVLGIDHFGASAPFQRIYDEFGLTADRVVEVAQRLARK